MSNKMDNFPRSISRLCYSEFCFIWLRDLDAKKIGAEIFGDLRNVVLEDTIEEIIHHSVSSAK